MQKTSPYKHVAISRNYGTGFFIVYLGKRKRDRYYTGRPLQQAEIYTDRWFASRAALLDEMVEDGTYTKERAQGLIGAKPTREKRPVVPIVNKPRITLRDFGAEWLAHKQTIVGAGKMAEYRKDLSFLCTIEILPRLAFGDIPLRELAAQHIDTLAITLSEREGVKGETMGHNRLNDLMVKVVRNLLMLAYEREYMDKNPYPWITKRRVERPDDIDPFSFDEMLAFLDALPDERWKRFYTVAFGTGLRTSEQFALEWQHVDFADKVLHIRQGYVRGRMTILKTAGSRRDVDMLPDIADAVEKQRFFTAKLGSSYVFPNSEGGPLHRDNMRNRIWNPTIARAGVRERNPYQTRHTFASLMLYEGEDPAWVARMLGHTDLRMIYECYGKYIRNRTRQDGTRFHNALQRAKVSAGCL